MSLVAPGSGRDGRVEKKDIEAFLFGGPPKTAYTTPTTLTPTASEEYVVVELGRTRYTQGHGK